MADRLLREPFVEILKDGLAIRHPGQQVVTLTPPKHPPERFLFRLVFDHNHEDSLVGTLDTRQGRAKRKPVSAPPASVQDAVAAHLYVQLTAFSEPAYVSGVSRPQLLWYQEIDAFALQSAPGVIKGFAEALVDIQDGPVLVGHEHCKMLEAPKRGIDLDILWRKGVAHEDPAILGSCSDKR